MGYFRVPIPWVPYNTEYFRQSVHRVPMSTGYFKIPSKYRVPQSTYPTLTARAETLYIDCGTDTRLVVMKSEDTRTFCTASHPGERGMRCGGSGVNKLGSHTFSVRAWTFASLHREQQPRRKVLTTKKT